MKQYHALRLRQVHELVAQVYGLSREHLMQRTNRAEIAQPRQVAMYLQHIKGASYPQIGRYWNGKHHTTVLYACQRVEKAAASDKDFHSFLSRVIESVDNLGTQMKPPAPIPTFRLIDRLDRIERLLIGRLTQTDTL